MILKKIEAFLDFGVNNYLLIDENSKQAVLIDCSGDFKEVKEELKKYNAKLKYILLTHGHFDHLYTCYEFKKTFNPIVVAPKSDKTLIDNLKVQCDMFGVKMPKKPHIDTYIDENSILGFGKYEINVIHTPGHTQGGVCYLIDNKLFSGDTIFLESIGRCDLPGGSFDEITQSITKIFTLDPETEVYPGHGPKTTIAHEMESNPYVNKNTMEKNTTEEQEP